MSKSSNWIRVNWENRCPICGKADWCLVSADGTAAICPRTESKRDLGEAGFLHVLKEREWYDRPTPAPKDRTVQDMTELAEKYRRAISTGAIEFLAKQLSVSTSSLLAFGVGWSSGHQAYTIPSWNSLVGRITGIQLRRTDGFKFAVKGSKFGLYCPSKPRLDTTMIVLEGASDTIAAYNVGFPVCCGRHNCAGGEGYVVAALEHEPDRVLICHDNDEPNRWGRRVGLDGAEKLAKTLKYHVHDVRVVAPPEGFKDFRAWASSGVTRPDIEREWKL